MKLVKYSNSDWFILGCTRLSTIAFIANCMQTRCSKCELSHTYCHQLTVDCHQLTLERGINKTTLEIKSGTFMFLLIEEMI